MNLNTNNPTCPNCGFEYIEWFREFNFDDNSEQVIKCHGCDKEFECNCTHTVSFDNFEVDNK